CAHRGRRRRHHGRPGRPGRSQHRQWSRSGNRLAAVSLRADPRRPHGVRVGPGAPSRSGPAPHRNIRLRPAPEAGAAHERGGLMNPEVMEALHALASEKGISVDTLFSALADALESAYKRMPGAKEYAWVTIDPDTM